MLIKNLLKYTIGLPFLLIGMVVCTIVWILLLGVCLIGAILSGDYFPVKNVFT